MLLIEGCKIRRPPFKVLGEGCAAHQFIRCRGTESTCYNERTAYQFSQWLEHISTQCPQIHHLTASRLVLLH